MRFLSFSLLSVGIVSAYCLIATWLNCETAKQDISRAILLAVLVFMWLMKTNPNRSFFS